MKIRKLICLLPLFLVGCQYPVHGTLQVNSAFSLKDHSKHAFELAPGDHSMEVKMDQSWGDTKLKMKLLDRFGKKRKITLHVPHSLLIPAYSGAFTLESTQTGQPFDLDGKFETIETDLPSVVYAEECGYGYYYYGGGTRLITTHQHNTTTQTLVDFKAAGKDETLAHYVGTHTLSETVIDSIGHCISS